MCVCLQGATDAMISALSAYRDSVLAQERERFGPDHGDDPSDYETSILCLQPAERSSLMGLVTYYSKHDSRKFRMLMEDLAKLCKRLTFKDALLTYLIAPDTRRPPKIKRRSMSAGPINLEDDS